MERLTGIMREDIYSDEHRKLREILRRERRAAGLRQSDLAERTGRSQAYISKFEKGDLRLDVVDFVRICTVIGCDVVRVLGEVFGEEQVTFKIGKAREETVKLDLSPSDVQRHKMLVADTPSAKPIPTRSKSDQHTK